MAMSYETFRHRGQIWTRYPAPKAEEAFICGVDLGQSMDPTAIIVLHASRTPRETWTTNEVAHTIKQDIEERWDVVHAERMPLGTSYPDIVAHIREVLARPPLHDDCDLVIDRRASAVPSVICSTRPG